MNDQSQGKTRCFSAILTPFGTVSSFWHSPDKTIYVEIDKKEYQFDFETIIGMNPSRVEFFKYIFGEKQIEINAGGELLKDKSEDYPASKAALPSQQEEIKWKLIGQTPPPRPEKPKWKIVEQNPIQKEAKRNSKPRKTEEVITNNPENKAKRKKNRSLSNKISRRSISKARSSETTYIPYHLAEEQARERPKVMSELLVASKVERQKEREETPFWMDPANQWND